MQEIHENIISSFREEVIKDSSLQFAMTCLNMALTTISRLGYEVPEKLEFKKIEKEKDEQ